MLLISKLWFAVSAMSTPKPNKNSEEDFSKQSSVQIVEDGGAVSKSKGPLNFLTGAITSGLFAWLGLGLSQRMVSYFTLHAPHYNSAIAQSIASGFKTLVIGICFLATFTFAFIGLGLTLVFFRSLFAGKVSDVA